MNKKKMLALQMLIEGNLSKKDIANRLSIDVSTLYRWAQEPEFRRHMEQCISAIRELITKNLTLLAERLVESVCMAAGELPAKESLEMLLKILEKSERIGLNLLGNNKNEGVEDFSSMTDRELKDTIMRYIQENGDEEY